MILKIERRYEDVAWFYLDGISELGTSTIVVSTEDLEKGFDPSKFLMDRYGGFNFCIADHFNNTKKKQPICFTVLTGVYKNGGFVLGFDTEAFLLSDAGKTVDRIVAN